MNLSALSPEGWLGLADRLALIGQFSADAERQRDEERQRTAEAKRTRRRAG